MDFEAIKEKYNAAFDAYHDIMKRNTASTLLGVNPNQADLEREDKALAVLSKARRDFFAALAPSL